MQVGQEKVLFLVDSCRFTQEGANLPGLGFLLKRDINIQTHILIIDDFPAEAGLIFRKDELIAKIENVFTPTEQ